MINVKAKKWFYKYIKKTYSPSMNFSDYAVKKGYAPSMVRAISYVNDTERKNAKDIRKVAEIKIKEFLNEFVSKKGAVNPFETIKEIRKLYDGKVSDYTYGNAQKWVFMSVKYWLISSCYDKGKNVVDLDADICKNFPYFPVDGIMIKNIKKDLCIDFGESWSKCDDLEKFKTYFKDISADLKKKKPTTTLIEYEIETW